MKFDVAETLSHRVTFTGTVESCIVCCIVQVVVSIGNSNIQISGQLLFDGEGHITWRCVGSTVRMWYETFSLIVSYYIDPVVLLIQHIHYLKRQIEKIYMQ